MPNTTWINPRTFVDGTKPPASFLNEITTDLAILGGKDSARAYKTTSTSALAVGKWTVLTFNKFRGTNAALMWDQTAPGRLICARAGLFLINGVVKWAGPAGVYGVAIFINGLTPGSYPSNVATDLKFSSVAMSQTVTTLWLCAAGDYIQLAAQPKTVSGKVAGSTSSAENSAELSAVWLSN